MISKDRLAVKRLSLAASTHIYNDTHDAKDFNHICSLNIQGSLKKIGFTLTLLFTAYVVMFLGPFYGLVRYGQRITTTSLKIPFVKPFSGLEFLVNLIVQFLMFLLGCPGNNGVEGLFALLMDATTASSKYYIQWQCKKFSEKLRLDQPKLRTNKMEFIRILRAVQSTDGYF